MCLLKRSDRDTNCGHDDCKNFYLLNKQVCIHNINQPNPPANPQNFSLNALQSQIQLGTFLSQKSGSFATSQQLLNGKRAANSVTDIEQDAIFLNKKQIKPEVDESKSEEINQNNYKNDNQTAFPELNLVSQQIINQNPAERGLQQASFINGIAPNNGQICFTKQENTSVPFSNSTIFIPFVQGPQANVNINTTYAPMVSNPQNGFNLANGTQVFPQNMRIKPTNNNIPNISSINLNSADMTNKTITLQNNITATPPTNISLINSNNCVASSNLTVETIMKEFQSRMSELLVSQNKMLIDLKEKNDIIQDTLACLINEMSALKSVIKQNNQEKVSPITLTSLLKTNVSVNSNEVATTDGLITYLYGPNPDFQYQLLMKSNFSLPLYRERNFKFTLILADRNGNPVENANKIPLTIAIYSSESVPKYIDANTAGNKILKGFIDKDLVNGAVTFDKIQIKEVTSHFRNGWVFFVVYPKVSNNTGNIVTPGKEIIPNTQKIRPYILEKVIVKAKKAKEKCGDEAEDAVFQEENQAQPVAEEVLQE